MTEPLGCIIDPEQTARAVERMRGSGLVVGFGEANDPLKGFAKREIERGRTHVFAQDAERSITGANRPAYRQTRGVCVSRGTGGAILDSYYFSLASGGRVGQPVDIATEPIYAGARVKIACGRLGNHDGAFGCDAAEYVSRFGVVSRSIYGGNDLTRADDELACFWGQPGRGVPAAVERAGAKHFVASHKVDSVDELADAIWAGYFGAECRPRWCSSVDGEGFGIFNNSGGHCTEICGAYIDQRAKLCFVAQQSHGSGRPIPNPVAHTTSGPRQLRDGCYPIRADQMAEPFQRGEVWVFSILPGHEFREAA